MTFPNEATYRQILAARPNVSTWLSANAGSGKTKVLTDRVARLLLQGTPPQHILCLTYTKAAASEMQNRLFKRLGEWSMKPTEALRIELQALDPEETLSEEMIEKARTLFATAVETPGGLKIQTIHSFCSALLRRFPMEAGVSAQFKEMDEAKSQELTRGVLDEIAQTSQDNSLDQAAAYITDLDATDLASQIIRNRSKFSKTYSKAEILSWFNLPADFNEKALIHEVFIGGEDEMLADAALAFAQGGKTDAKNAPFLKFCSKQKPSSELIGTLCKKLLSSDKSKIPFISKFGAKHSPLPSQAAIKAHPTGLHQLEAFIQRLEAARPKLMGYYDAQRTIALHALAAEILPQYNRRKEVLGLLDFDDMITKARDLLSISDVAEWVLFRLDGGIDHILVDEAQDTSPDQWKVVEHLAGEFTAGAGARSDVERTIFVVGDQKQSIYSFQGAAPEAFNEMKAEFSKRLESIDRPLQDLAMEHSFRSSPAILGVTDHVFKKTDGRGVGGQTNHIAFFEDMPGRVDLWPLMERVKDDQADLPWDEPIDLVAPEHHNIRLADKIADHVAKLIKHGAIDKGTDKEGKPKPTAIEAGDILILVRNRSGLFMPLLNALKSHPAQIPVSGADQLTLGEELAVKDLLSLLSFLSLQDDDLSLAEALRSPLLGWSEQDLYRLAYGRTSTSLWQALRSQKEQWPQTLNILDDLRQYSDYMRPYELLERILIEHKGRSNLLARLGEEAEDGINELLNQARQYESVETPSLTGFLAWFSSQEIKVKRVLGESANLVRVMTSHGSKGLEAPIVILPDTLRTPKEPSNPLVDIGDKRIVWRGAKDQRSEQAVEAIHRIKQADIEEDRRLLYVAMTRAEKWLIVCGAGNESKNDPTWYSLIKDALTDLGVEANQTGLMRYQSGEWPERHEPNNASTRQQAQLPQWYKEIPTQDVESDRNISPSQLQGAKALAGEEGESNSEAAMRRGRQIHALLEYLPNVEEHAFEEEARIVLNNSEDALIEEELPALLSEVRDVILEPYEWNVFQENALIEVPFSAKIPALGSKIIHGIIDRILIHEDKIQIIDYKTNRVLPEDYSQCPDGVLNQLAAYAIAARNIYPKHQIEVAILWTKEAKLMPIPLDFVMQSFNLAYPA